MKFENLNWPLNVLTSVGAKVIMNRVSNSCILLIGGHECFG